MLSEDLKEMDKLVPGREKFKINRNTIQSSPKRQETKKIIEKLKYAR